jgi:uncharacterized protein
MNPVLSHYQARPLLQARKDSKEMVLTSTDLGMSKVEARLDEAGVRFPGDERIRWEDLQEISVNPNGCYRVMEDRILAIRGFSELTGRSFSLYPTESAPTMLISGLPMHRIKDTNPYQDTREKIRAASPVRGHVLDTATGLGYTAIEAARTAEKVITIELDPLSLEMARANPWSQTLFTDAHIHQVEGDSFEEIERFEEGIFSLILHDPPVFSLGGELYSEEFYRMAWRVLKARGRMFHYIGDPDSKSGARMTRGVIQRLKSAGFREVNPQARAFGVVAYK